MPAPARHFRRRLPFVGGWRGVVTFASPMIRHIGYPQSVTVTRKIAAVMLAPVALWLLATAMDVVRHKPDALETPLLWLAFIGVLYLPLFAVAAVLPVVIARYLEYSMPTWLGGLGTGCLAAGIAAASLTTSSNAVLLCALVGAFLGAAMTRDQRADTPASSH
jgi:hypothetical protein